MSIRTLLIETHDRLKRNALELPRWFRWLDTEAPAVADKYRLMLRRMWVYWFPALFILAAFILLSDNMALPAELNRLRPSIGIAAFSIIVLLLPGLAVGRIGFAAYRWHCNKTGASSRRMIFFILLCLATCVVYTLAAIALFAVSVFIMMA